MPGSKIGGHDVSHTNKSEPTGKKITWVGAAFFKTNGEQITELWVLGDIDAVKQQLGAETNLNFESD